MTLDPVRLALVQKRLDFVSRHMGWVMTRTARSPIFSQSHDFSCFLTDGAGTLVSNADGIPIHTGGGGFAVRALLGVFGDGVSGGDVLAPSQVYTAGIRAFAAKALLIRAKGRGSSTIGGGAGSSPSKAG